MFVYQIKIFKQCVAKMCNILNFSYFDDLSKIRINLHSPSVFNDLIKNLRVVSSLGLPQDPKGEGSFLFQRLYINL